MHPRSLITPPLAAVALSCAAIGCQQGPSVRAYPLVVEAVADGKPLAGLQVRLHERELGATDAAGSFATELRGEEGQRVKLQVACPDGYREPEQPAPLTLRTMAALPSEDGQGEPALAATRVSVECLPDQRMAVLVVRADGKPNLPILVHGEEVGRTSADGVGHAMLELEPGAELHVSLDTSSLPVLRPKNPARRFRIADEDSILVFDQPFEERVVEKKRKRRKKKKVVQHVPYRME